MDAPHGGGPREALPRALVLAGRRADQRPRVRPPRWASTTSSSRSIACSTEAGVQRCGALRRLLRRASSRRATQRSARSGVRALVLASALAPGYTPDARVRFYLRAPWLLSPLFCVNAWRRSRREIRAALPAHRDRLAFSAGQLWRVAAHPTSPALMRDRMRLLEGVDFASSMSSIVAPTLLITGEPALDSVVPPHHTLGYTRFLPHAESLTFERTGHIGLVTRPAQFAETCGRALSSAPTGADRVGAGRRKWRAEHEHAAAPRDRRARPAASKRCSSGRCRCGCAAARGGGLCAPASAARRHDAHEGGVPGNEGAWRAWAVPCSASTSAASGRARARSTTPSGELEDFRAGLDFMASRYPGADLWAAGFSFGAYVALTAGDRDDRVSTLIGIAPALHMYDFSEVGCEPQGQVLRAGRAGRDLPARATAGVLRRASANRSSSSWCQARTICSTDRWKRSGVRSRDVRRHARTSARMRCENALGDTRRRAHRGCLEGARIQRGEECNAGCGDRFRGAHGRGQGAGGHAARHEARRDGRRRAARGARARARARRVRGRRRDHGLRDAGGRAGIERRAHREPACRRTGDAHRR